jgi:four helix bundle protein
VAQRFEDIIVWQKARELSNDVYRAFYNCKDYAFCDQIRRASVSVMNNIAEGSERSTDKEFRQFLYIAKGSCGEVRSMLILAQDQEYITADAYALLGNRAEQISKMLAGFIKKLQT